MDTGRAHSLAKIFVERDSFPSRLEPLCRRCRGADRRVIARRRYFPPVALIFARRSARIHTCCVSGNPSALVLPSVKHFLLQTLSSNRIRHRCVLLTLSSFQINVVAKSALIFRVISVESYHLRSSGRLLPTPFTYRFELTHALLPQPVEIL